MDRKPIYHNDNPAIRVISVPNGLWQPQRHANFKGNRESDPWKNFGAPMSRADAIKRLDRMAHFN